ncbi:right-handed parallel beta-helix repeat-containing protein [Tuwongella immobilis]|uniref:Right handed beta helix domain-containing protein n=1 Tax=Tuwongella immobilis TaxID=692036 RepID=A0A6C2YU28_9BACT|nr:right-handed parallel beta-helix repeat-containing protein [Tuwongella immobilis]VIP04633.1 Uncharacterized protein OS=Chthoniobacter flavus Ellin428 GN=CfE428DRAFT_4394 PE=4 SV=1: Beta_helix [Tuwongella immobilis]VTS06627.1 Uncharacterized protein OS=Chthoniobacter flavus Ellin428 GN=CfE428DRAFT_4394 PE=4 SV=1: Beta_helix [Tuwongella immobilis]
MSNSNPSIPQSELSHRRQFLRASLAAGAAFAGIRAADAEEPTRAAPRAVSGDPIEPNWDERLTITVGTKDADLVGTNEKVIQAAVDLVARRGGGTVKILPGVYRLRNAVTLASNIRLQGSGADSVLIKEPSIGTKLVADTDWYDQEITLADASGFRVGDGICLRAKSPHSGAMQVVKRTLVARSGNRFKLDRAVRENFWQLGNSTVETLFPILTGEFLEQVKIDNLTLDGNRSKNAELDGNYAGCIFLQDCRGIRIERVDAGNYHGDGISFQICHDVHVEECYSHDHSGLGMHPGSGSQRPVMRRNRLERNQIGIFFCWGVKNGIAEENRCIGNRGSGISIGHRDTDNLIRKNRIESSGEVGILFRPERGPSFAGHRNLILENEIVDSGGDAGIAIDVQGGTEEIRIIQNRIEETRGKMNRIGIRLGKSTQRLTLKDNRIQGVLQAIQDLRGS